MNTYHELERWRDVPTLGGEESDLWPVEVLIPICLSVCLSINQSGGPVSLSLYLREGIHARWMSRLATRC